MKVAIYLGKTGSEAESRLESLVTALAAGGCECVRFDERNHLPEDTEMVLSVGGDGTFLSAARIAAEKGVPVAGVNLGRLGFLSENRPEDVAQSILSGDYEIEERAMLRASISNASKNTEIDRWPYALNEVTVHRNGAAMLGVDVCLDGKWLPTYWADGLIVSTSSGSTAYSLSVGGPIVLPEAKVLIISPIAPHNLNIRPLVVPDSSEILLRLHTRDGNCVLTTDNHSVIVDEDVEITVTLAHFSLRRVRLNRSDFINALTEKLHWGEDLRNNK
jgi:NAD+ kinase